MTTNRARIARETAGLSVDQAARLLGMTIAEIAEIELRDSAFADADHDVYHVRVEWLTGEVELRDYSAVDGMRGAEGISSHDHPNHPRRRQ